MNKVRLNYWLDAVIALAFVMSALSGMVFLFTGSGGYQGGHNADFQTTILGISRWTWSDLHTWASLVMIAGVGLHLILHWKWIVCMTQRLLPQVKPAQVETEEDACPAMA